MSTTSFSRARSARDVTLVVLLALCAAVLVAPAHAARAAHRNSDVRQAATTTVLDDRALTRAGTWRSLWRSTAYQHTLSKSRTRGSTLTSPTKTVAGGSVRLQFGPRRGRLQIWVGGVRRTTVRTGSATRRYVNVAFGGTGDVVLKVGRPRRGVYVDKLTVTPPPRLPLAGEVVITEIMADPNNADATREWFEVTSLAPVEVSLGGCHVNHDGPGTTPLDSFTLQPHGIAIVARSKVAAENGGLPSVAATFSFDLTADALTTTDYVSLTCHGTLIDQSAALYAEPGIAKGLSSAWTTAAGNDASGHWCQATTQYGTEGDYGTPGAANPVCP